MKRLMKKGLMKKVVMAFGAFDGIHSGHLYYLNKAKKLGNYFVVAIARDKTLWKFLRRYKLNEKERKLLVESIGIADKVVLGSKTNALERVKELKPDIIVITPYNPVNPQLLQMDLKRIGLKTKVVSLKKYLPKTYDLIFKINKKLTKKELLGLSPKN